ncbi:hypothetical protein B0H14DRAFT_3716988 [Mycena olivaceomarginata]|nr:hypothetical protein B0H14DRAFT_3716988 [Mycena olivaceomarginata]
MDALLSLLVLPFAKVVSLRSLANQAARLPAKALARIRVVSPSQAPRGPSAHTSTSPGRESYTRSETVPPLLTADVDYGQLDSDKGSDDDNWTTVTKKTSRTHRERAVSHSSRETNTSELTSTVEIATHDMSPENLLKLSHRYGQLAAAGFRARVESQRSTVEPQDDFSGNKGSVPASAKSAPHACHRARAAGKTLARVSQTRFEAQKKHLKELKRRQKSHKVNKSTSKAEDAVRDSVVQQMHIEPQNPVNEGPKKCSSKSVAGRLPPGGFFEQVIRDTKRVGQPTSPPDDPSSSSSSSEASSSSDDESEAAGADSTLAIANDAHRKKSR